MIAPPYHKIPSIFKRTEKGIIIPGEFSTSILGDLYDSNFPFIWREKVDGTNIRISFDMDRDPQFLIQGRTNRAIVPPYLQVAIENLGLAEILPERFPEGVTLYGEGYGPKIQKAGKLYRNDHSFVLFDVQVGHPWDRRSRWHDQDAIKDVARYLGIDSVPIIISGISLREAIDMIDPFFLTTIPEGLPRLPQLANKAQSGGYAESETFINHFPGIDLLSRWSRDSSPFRAEGLVGLPWGDLLDREGNRIITKIKCVDFEKLRASR